MAVNQFDGARKKENLTKINAWYVEFDEGSKKDHLERIRKGLIPSLIIESKRGYHCYWFSKDASIENYKNIIEQRLIPFYGSDPNPKDISRILRAPGFFHKKDPNDPFLVKEVFKKNYFYKEAELKAFYDIPPHIKKKLLEKEELKKEFKKENGSGSLFEKIYSLDCEEALLKLSGHPSVGGEYFSFKKVSNGNLNIFVNNKSTSCFIDRDKKIGSLSGGGPTIFAWLKWYGNSAAESIRVIKEVLGVTDEH